jgi:hypothetical protein
MGNRPEQRGRVDAHHLVKHRVAIGRNRGKSAARSRIEKQPVNRSVLRLKSVEGGNQLPFVADISRRPSRIQTGAQFA